MHSKDYWNLQSGCQVNMSRCRNFSFVMVSNNKKVYVRYRRQAQTAFVLV